MVECAAALRKEHNRDEKMKRVTEQLITESEGQEVWREVHPHLDQAIDELPPGDRDIVLLRFWEKKSFREIGTALGKTEGASQKQTERALEKLSHQLRRRGVAISVGALTAGISMQLSAAVPAALITTISQGALAAAPALTTGTLILKSIEAMTYAKTKTALAVAVVAAVPLGIQWNANQDLQHRLTQAEARLQAVSTVVAEATSKRHSSPEPVPSLASNPTLNSNAPSSLTPSAPADITSLWRQALAETDPLKRSLAISTLLNSVNADNALEIAAVFAAAHQTGARYTDEHKMFMRAWGSRRRSPRVTARHRPDR
jgi:hypothetical protein